MKQGNLYLAGIPKSRNKSFVFGLIVCYGKIQPQAVLENCPFKTFKTMPAPAPRLFFPLSTYIFQEVD